MRISAESLELKSLALSHGWVHLSPFVWQEDLETLGRPLVGADSQVFNVRIATSKPKKKTDVRISVLGEHVPDAQDRIAIRAQVRRMLRLDEDFSDFWSIYRNHPGLKYACRKRMGRMLRGPNAFEDLIKTVCTTNCDWRNTKKMCEALCRIGKGSFPTAEQIARIPLKRLTDRVPCGYRANTIKDIARLYAAGKLELDRLAADGDYEQVRFILGKIKGVGPYTINHMLVLLGCYSEIPIDSEVLKYLREIHFDGEPVSPAEAVKPYEQYGEQKFLVYKFGRIARRLNYIDK